LESFLFLVRVHHEYSFREQGQVLAMGQAAASPIGLCPVTASLCEVVIGGTSAYAGVSGALRTRASWQVVKLSGSLELPSPVPEG
jgi:hypothetical protein